MNLQALLFDVDGTLADTEEAHRQAFNEAFAVHGLPWRWDPELYIELLQVTGGKERVRAYVASLGLPAAEVERIAQLVPQIHETKTRHLASLIALGKVSLRPGIARLIAEARAAGLPLAIASTTSPANVHALLSKALDPEAVSWFRVIATGDVVAQKKPAPDIYLLALAQLGCAPEDCVAFEDSELGVRAANAAGLFTVATPNRWTAGHDLSAADLVLPSLGDPGDPLEDAPAAIVGGRWLDLAALARLHASGTTARKLDGVAS
jgi:HAD superfamily hydrolase (TIGR01509 family)